MNRPVHFEIPAGDSTRMIDFYNKVFGWQFHKWEGPGEYWLISTGEGPGINGGLMPRREPGGLTVNTMDVESVDDAVKKVLDNGGTQAVTKIAIPGVGWLAYCKDPEGTLFGLMQNDPTAKR